ncbi:hypothetical protein HOY82DRAFT_601646 [Tuber indicum]|nr:hypothetical protein HOY82DRAFT_601646 [Tuber indicum]
MTTAVRSRGKLSNIPEVQPQPGITQVPTTSLEYKANRDGFPTNAMWLAWMDRHPGTANEWYDRGHPKVVELFRLENSQGKRGGFLGYPYCLPDNDGSFPNSAASSTSPATQVSSASLLSVAPPAKESVVLAPGNNRSLSASPRIMELPDISMHNASRASVQPLLPDSSTRSYTPMILSSEPWIQAELDQPVNFVRPEDIMDTTDDIYHEWRSLPAIESDTDDEVHATHESYSPISVLEVYQQK